MFFFNWAPRKLGAGLTYILNGGLLSEAEARSFLREIQAHGETKMLEMLGDEYKKYFPTNRHGGAWKDGQPTGVVDHYTAGISIKSPLRWFSNMPRQSPGSSSAHIVLDKDGTLYTLLHPLEKVAYHATIVNSTHVGIEHVNAGMIKKNKAGDGFIYMDKYRYPADNNALPCAVTDTKGNGKINWWEPYTIYQVCSNIVYKRLLCMAHTGFKREQFIDHEMVDPKRKIDCGPMWPMDVVNDLVFSKRSPGAVITRYVMTQGKECTYLRLEQLDSLSKAHTDSAKSARDLAVRKSLLI